MQTVLLFGILLLVIWCAVITYLYITLNMHYNTLTQGVHKKTLSTVLDRIVSDLLLSKKDIEILKNRCDTMEKESKFYIQKIGLVRFNPFKDTGGDQSFILSLLDANNTGVVISGLFSRSGVRWYAKKVVKGEGFEHELSEDEKKALKAASSTRLV